MKYPLTRRHHLPRRELDEGGWRRRAGGCDRRGAGGVAIRLHEREQHRQHRSTEHEKRPFEAARRERIFNSQVEERGPRAEAEHGAAGREPAPFRKPFDGRRDRDAVENPAADPAERVGREHRSRRRERSAQDEPDAYQRGAHRRHRTRAVAVCDISGKRHHQRRCVVIDGIHEPERCRIPVQILMNPEREQEPGGT